MEIKYISFVNGKNADNNITIDEETLNNLKKEIMKAKLNKVPTFKVLGFKWLCETKNGNAIDADRFILEFMSKCYSENLLLDMMKFLNENALGGEVSASIELLQIVLNDIQDYKEQLMRCLKFNSFKGVNDLLKIASPKWIA